MTQQLTLEDQADLHRLRRSLREFHAKRHASDLCREIYHLLCRRVCELDGPAYRRMMVELGVTGTTRPTLSAEERRSALGADERGDYASLPSRIGRLADARDATVQGLAELRARPDARPQNARRLYSQLDSHERELAGMRRAAGHPLADLLTFGEGGDVLGRAYLGYIVAFLADREVGRLDYTYLDGELGIRHVRVDGEQQRQGVATALLERMRAEEPLCEVFFFGDVLSAEGRAWAEHHRIERWR